MFELTIEKVTKQYSGNDYQAVKSCDMKIKSGDFISIQGESGSGKSSLLLMMSGLLPPTSGRVLWNGESIYDMSDNALSIWRSKNVGYLFQNVQLVQALTVRENMLLSRSFGNDPTLDIEALITLFGLEDEANKLPSLLSGGQRRRAMIACVLSRDPLIVCADEPTNDLDSVWASKIMAILNDLKKKDKAIVLVTHDSRWITDDQIQYVMENGELNQA